MKKLLTAGLFAAAALFVTATAATTSGAQAAPTGCDLVSQVYNRAGDFIGLSIPVGHGQVLMLRSKAAVMEPVRAFHPLTGAVVTGCRISIDRNGDGDTSDSGEQLELADFNGDGDFGDNFEWIEA